MHFSAAELLAEGLLADPRAAVAINDRAAMPGTGDHARVLEISLYGGLSLEILPARGLDIGEVRYLGEPVAWISPIRDARPATAPRGTDFVAHFNGGLLATCGLRNIGPATSDEPMHGDYTFLPAENVHWQAEVTAETVAAAVTGQVRSISLFGASFLVRRRITAAVHAGRGAEITVTDEVENLGPQPAALHMLYHVNLGAPLVVPGTRVHVDAARTTARDAGTTPEWQTLPGPADNLGEAVYEHVQPVANDEGQATAYVTNGSRRVEIAWSAATLPRLYQWVFPARGRWALGIEPATAPLFGPDRDAAHGGAPLVGAGQVRQQRLTVRIAADLRYEQVSWRWSSAASSTGIAARPGPGPYARAMAGTAAAEPPQTLSRLEAGTTAGEALSFFDSLPPVTVTDMIGAWRGSELAVGNPLNGLLDNLGWHGKRFDSADRVYPLIFADRRGLFSINPAFIPAAAAVRYSRVLHSPLFPGLLFGGVARPALRLLRTSRPTARLRMMEYRGVLTGTMCYDALPANDHFRQVSRDVLLGAMDLRGLAEPFLFVLRRESPAGGRDGVQH